MKKVDKDLLKTLSDMFGIDQVQSIEEINELGGFTETQLKFNEDNKNQKKLTELEMEKQIDNLKEIINNSVKAHE